MEHRQLGKDGPVVSVIGFGAWPIGGWMGLPYPTPAWDFKHRVRDPQEDKWYRFAGRLALKEFAGPDDAMREYEAWNAEIRSNRTEQYND